MSLCSYMVGSQSDTELGLLVDWGSKKNEYNIPDCPLHLGLLMVYMLYVLCHLLHKYKGPPGQNTHPGGCVCLPAERCAAYTVTWTPGRNVNWTRFWFKALSRTSESCRDTEGDMIWITITITAKITKTSDSSSRVFTSHNEPYSDISEQICLLFWSIFPWIQPILLASDWEIISNYHLPFTALTNVFWFKYLPS